MSVVKSKRGQGKLEILTKSRELTAYTIKICTNEKSFPKRYRWCITNKIVENTVSIDEGELSREIVDECYTSWKAHAKKGNTFNLLNNMDKYYESLWS